MEPFSATGSWWIPGFEDRKVGGTLTFEYGNDGPRLRLIGSFPVEAAEQAVPIRKFPIVFGETLDGASVTLRNTRVVNDHSILRDLGSDGPRKYESHELDAQEIYYGGQRSDFRSRAGIARSRCPPLVSHSASIWARTAGEITSASDSRCRASMASRRLCKVPSTRHKVR
ncbi:MAG: ApeA N-terminal domain 1 [Acidimicrobiaceae bacterium]|nr:ApeA N-terminal domain 1 [Acidimicrobiaceae bacterium]